MGSYFMQKIYNLEKLKRGKKMRGIKGLAVGVLVLIFCMGSIAVAQADKVDELINQLKDDNSEVRKKAAEGLSHIKGHIKAGCAVEPLIVALKDIDGEVRRKAAEALGMIGDSRAVKPLITALKDTNVSVRTGTVAALGMIKDESVVEPLIGALRDGNGYVGKQEKFCRP